MGASAQLAPQAEGSASLNRFGEVDTLFMDYFEVRDAATGEIVVAHSLNLEVKLECPQDPDALQAKLTTLLWDPETLIPEDRESSYEVPFVNPFITGAILNDVEVSFTLAGQKWFTTGRIPIRDFTLSPSLFVDVLVRAMTESGKDSV